MAQPMQCGFLSPCQYCGSVHQGVCPRVKAISYSRGEVTCVEFHPPPAPPPGGDDRAKDAELQKRIEQVERALAGQMEVVRRHLQTAKG